MVTGIKEIKIIKTAIGIIYVSGLVIIPPRKYPASSMRETQKVPPIIL